MTQPRFFLNCFNLVFVSAAVFLLGIPAEAEPPSITPPQLLSSQSFPYPDEAIRENVQGTVVLLIDITATGDVLQAKIIESPHPALNDVALFRASTMVFSPAKEGDTPFAAQIRLELEFTLPPPTPKPKPTPPPAPTPYKSSEFETIVIEHIGRKEAKRKPLALDPTPTISRYTLTRRDIELTPGSLEDVTRTLQSLPGVVADPGLMATFFVRGGDSSDVVFYLDGMPLSFPFHLGGFVSLFNPELVDQVNFFSGGQPSAYRDSLSGALEVQYVSGNAERYEAMIDVSMNTAKGLISGPTPIEGLTFLASARRSYFEAYFETLAAFGLVGSQFAAPDLGEYLVKLSHVDGSSQIDALVLYSSDGLNFIGDANEDTLFSFDGSLSIRNQSFLSSLRWRNQPTSHLKLHALAGLTVDSNFQEQRSGIDAANPEGTLVSSESASHKTGVGRLDAEWFFTSKNVVRTGIELRWIDSTLTSTLKDSRSLPQWSALPLADYHLGLLSIEPTQTETFVSGYLENEWTEILPRLSSRVGVRAQSNGGSWSEISPRVALSLEVTQATFVKATGGYYYQQFEHPLQKDPGYRNDSLRAQKSTQAIVGIEQFLPGNILLKIEGYHNRLSNLAVKSDLPSPGPLFNNDGYGLNWGVDSLLMHRTNQFGAGVSYGYLVAERINPRHEIFQRRYAPHQDQRHTLGLMGDYRPGKTWVVSARYQFSTGRPLTAIRDFVLGEEDGEEIWIPQIGDVTNKNGLWKLNNLRRPDFHELSIRLEWWVRQPTWRMTFYSEILNVFNHMSTFAQTFDAGDPSNGVEPKAGEFTTLPIRPFIGFRFEY